MAKLAATTQNDTSAMRIDAIGRRNDYLLQSREYSPPPLNVLTDPADNLLRRQRAGDGDPPIDDPHKALSTPSEIGVGRACEKGTGDVVELGHGSFHAKKNRLLLEAVGRRSRARSVFEVWLVELIANSANRKLEELLERFRIDVFDW